MATAVHVDRAVRRMPRLSTAKVARQFARTVTRDDAHRKSPHELAGPKCPALCGILR